MSLVVPYMPNYYHWIAEGVTLFDRLVLRRCRAIHLVLLSQIAAVA